MNSSAKEKMKDLIWLTIAPALREDFELGEIEEALVIFKEYANSLTVEEFIVGFAKIKVVTIENEGDVEVLLFTDDDKLLSTMKERAEEWVDEDTEKEQQKVLDHINKIDSFDEFSEYVCDKFDIVINIREQEVIK